MADEKTCYLIPILLEEKDQIRQANTKEKRKQVLADIFKSQRPRPSETNFFIFIIQETILSKGFLFGFVTEFRSSEDRTRQSVTAWSSFAFQNDGSEMFVSFRNRIKKKKKHKIPGIEADRLLVSGLKEKYDTIRKKIYEALSTALQSFNVKTPIQIQQNKKIVQSYIHDVKKPIDPKHSELERQINMGRKLLLQMYVSKPSLSLENVSKKNRLAITQMRHEHQKQLLARFGKSRQQIPQQIDPDYRKEIIKYRMEQQKKRLQQQQLVNKMKPFKQQIQLFVRSYEHDPKSLAEEVVLRQLGLLDPVTLQRIDNPVILPTSSRTIMEKNTLQDITEDPISREPLPQNKQSLPVNRSILETIQSVKQEMASIVKSSLPLDVKVFKLIQLRENTKQSIDDLRFPQKKQKKKKQQLQKKKKKQQVQSLSA